MTLIDVNPGSTGSLECTCYPFRQEYRKDFTEASMDNTKKPSLSRIFVPFIIVPITAIVDIGLIALGGWMDVSLYNPMPDTIGTPVPVLTVIFMLIAAGISIIAFIVLAILVITGIVKYSKQKKALNDQTVPVKEQLP